MIRNKIYYNYLGEIFKIFSVILLCLSLIAITVRAVNFLELIVDSGYSIQVYFSYSILNFFGIATKFIIFSFFLSIIVFIIRHVEDNEFVILWTSGVKKIKLVNLFLLSSLCVIIFYLILSTTITPLVLNKSRILLSQGNVNSLMPVLRPQEFTDSFKDLTFFVQKKNENQIENLFLNDKGNTFRNISADSKKSIDTTIIAKYGLINEDKMLLKKGKIISSHENESKIISFDQLRVDLSELKTTTIKQPKLQETSTITLLKCFIPNYPSLKICDNKLKNEIIPILLRRIFLPFYLPVLVLICSLLLIKSDKKYFHKTAVFSYCILLVLFTEISVRYTGIDTTIRYFFLVLPVILSIMIYILLNLKFLKEQN